jgi:hypothetical protein
MRYPVLYICAPGASVMEDEATLRFVLARTTNKAIRSGITETTRILDSDGKTYRVRVRLAPGGLLGGRWLRPRKVEALGFEEIANRPSLATMRASLATMVRAAETIWVDQCDVAELVRSIEAAQTVGQLMGSGHRKVGTSVRTPLKT